MILGWYDFVLAALIIVNVAINPPVGIGTILCLILFEIKAWRRTTREAITDDVLKIIMHHIATGELKVEVNLDKEMKGWRS